MMEKARKWNRRASLFALLAALSLVLGAFLTDRMHPVLRNLPPEYLKASVIAAIGLTILFALAAAFCHCAYLDVQEREAWANRRERNRARIAAIEEEISERRSFWSSMIKDQS